MASEKGFDLEIVTPVAAAFKGEVVSVTVPGTLGQFQVLKGHAALLSSVEKGVVKIQLPDKSEQSFSVSGGVFEVSNNQATLLAESVETPKSETPK